MPQGPGPSDGCQRVVISEMESDANGNYDAILTSLDGGPGWNTGVGSDAYPRQVIESADASAGVVITVDPEPTETISVTDLIISVDTAMTVTIRDNSSPTPLKLFKFFMPANGTIQITPRGWLQVTTGKKLSVITSASGNIAITSFYKVTPAAS